MELELLVQLCNRLRANLGDCGLHPMGWYGPGAIATAVLKKHGLKNVITRDLPDEVKKASAYAYFGGRFEQYQTGMYEGKVYSYDIRSAYPAALSTVPNLSQGRWVHRNYPRRQKFSRLHDFALYRIFYQFNGSDQLSNVVPHPFPMRHPDNTTSYPEKVTGWYWGVEVKAALKYHRKSIAIFEGWEFVEDDSNDRPFAFLVDYYNQRREWKKQGNPAQLGLKLSLNSIYGKLAQRVGWDEETMAPPRWHQLEYAGFATSATRATIYTAMMQAPFSIIATETDGLYSTSPLTLTMSTELGAWEEEQYDAVVYVQSGMYWLKKGEQWVKARVRGFGNNSVGLADALKSLETLSPIVGRTNRFGRLHGFLGKKQWRTWITKPHEAKWGGGGKRVHSHELCPKCCGSEEQMHTLINSPHTHYGGKSSTHDLPWAVKNAEGNVVSTKFQISATELRSRIRVSRLQAEDGGQGILF